MNNPNSHRLPPPNPVTQHLHRRQVWWQILLPLIAGIIIFLVLAVLVSLGSASQVTRFSDISILVLVIPTVILGLIVLALFGALVYLFARLLNTLPSYLHVGQLFLQRITDFLKGISDKAATPVITLDSTLAGIQAFLRRQKSSG